MKPSGERYTFGLATPADSRELLQIMEEEKSPGKISLMYTRRPNAMKSFVLEGEKTSVVVCRDEKHKNIAGFGALTARQLYINGKKTKVGYLFGIRVRKEYRRKLRIQKGYEVLRKLHTGLSCCFTTILDNNTAVQRMLEKKRPGIPQYIPWGLINTYVLKTGNRKKLPKGYQFKRCTEEDMDQLIRFANEHGKNLQFFPILSKEYLESNPTLTYNDFYMLYKNEELVASGAVWDQKSYKQLYVHSYGSVYRLLYRFPFLFSLLGYPRLEKPGKRINYFSLAHWVVKNNDISDLQVFVNSISKITGKYSYFLVGVHEKSVYNTMLRTMTKMIYKSKLYLVNWNQDKEPNLDKNLVPYIESGAL